MKIGGHLFQNSGINRWKDIKEINKNKTMKTLRNLFGTKETKKSINNFSSKLDFNTMIKIKGGESDDDNWPPTGTSTGSSTVNNKA